eukprot:scaffold27324_cov63-Cyclotella_meneghiniana.AAC.5
MAPGRPQTPRLILGHYQELENPGTAIPPGSSCGILRVANNIKSLIDLSASQIATRHRVCNFLRHAIQITAAVK